MVIAVIISALYLGYIVYQSTAAMLFLGRYGYIGIFLISVISSLNLFVPIPAIAFLPLYLESGLNFWVIILSISAGMTLGDSIAYLLGSLGRHAEQYLNRPVAQRIFKLQRRFHFTTFIILFLFALLIPLPNEILVIPLGFLRYPYRLALPALLSGNFLFNVLFAYGVSELWSLI